jgi:hypothetical protein
MNSGINFDKYEEIPVEATGRDCPAPISHVGYLDYSNQLCTILVCGLEASSVD